jgi:hypothetical protein
MMEDRHAFRLSEAELEYLKQLVAREEALTDLLRFQEVAPGGKATIQLNIAGAERLRDFLTTQLATVGFDENYSPNEQGRVLEKLIDRFYVPRA